MNRMLIVTVLGLSLAGAGVARSQSASGADAAAAAPASSLAAAPAAQQAAPAAAPVKKERRICKEINSTGSRVSGSNVCLTKSQWDARAAEDSRATDRIQRGNLNVGSDPQKQ